MHDERARAVEARRLGDERADAQDALDQRVEGRMQPAPCGRIFAPPWASVSIVKVEGRHLG